jgi:nitrogen fixation protein NifU and related proteins
MSDYNELYQEVILEHNKKPRNFKVLDAANHYAVGKNPLCGDQFAVYLTMNDDGTIDDIGFQGTGCAIAKASASLMTTQVKGKSSQDALQLKDEFHKMVTGELDTTQEPHHLGKLTLFSGVQEYPARVKCATLAWHTLEAAMAGTQQEITTE